MQRWPACRNSAASWVVWSLECARCDCALAFKKGVEVVDVVVDSLGAIGREVEEVVVHVPDLRMLLVSTLDGRAGLKFQRVWQ